MNFCPPSRPLQSQICLIPWLHRTRCRPERRTWRLPGDL